MKKPYSQISLENLRRTLFLYLAVILLIFSLFLILTIANPIYQRLKESENNNVYNNVELTAMAVNEWGRRVMDIAVQVTSRTRIRQELEKYNNNEISLPQLKTFTEPKLSDAMNMSEEIIGITRVDRLGKVVAQCGEPIQLQTCPIDYSVPFDTSVSTPVIQNGRHIVVVSAPIINRSKKYIGADLVLIDLYQLKSIISRGTSSEKNYETILGYTSNGKVFKIFNEIKNIKNDEINDLLKNAFKGQEGMNAQSPVFVAAYHGLDIKNFGLVILQNKTELYKGLNTRLIHWGLTGIFAYIFFLAGFWFLMKPLANRLLLRSDELNEKVEEQTRHLEEEIQQRKRTEDELKKIITEHKQTEIALSESETRLSHIIMGSPVPTFVIDTDHVITHWNLALEKVSGISGRQVVGTKNQWMPFYSKKRPVMADLIVDQVSEEKLSNYYIGIYKKSQSVENAYEAEDFFPDMGEHGQWLFFTAAPLRNSAGDIIGAVETLQDTSARKEAETALRESESKFRSIFDNKGTATFLFGEDHIIRECNLTFEELCGYSKSDIINKMKWSDFIAKENLEKMQKYHDQRSKGTGSPPSQYESRIVNKAGEVKTVIANVSLIGKQRIVSLTDITEQTLAAIENEQLHKKLAQAQKMEAIGSLAGGIAHDFNNILGAIIGYTELAKMDKIDSKEIGKHLNKVLIAADRAKNLVHQILTFSRQTEQKIRPLKVGPIIKEVLQLLRASLPSTIEIQSDINNKSLIMGDPTQIHQVILNLCTNAGHAMQENGGTLYVGLTNEKLGPNFTSSIPDASTDDYAKIEVKDTGHSIPPELIERLFEPFFTTKGPGEGTGMGLAVVHGIVKSMKGEIIVESVLGKGSAFSVYLPVVQDMAKTDEPKENALAKGRGHILFVDDEPSMVDIGELILTQLGYHVTIRTSGIEALEAFKSNPDKFDLVLTDMTMPRMTGEKLAKEILSIRKEIPIIICTGFSSAMTEEKALEIGVKGLLMKPFIFSELAGVIHNVLKKELSNVHCCQCKSEGSICTRT
ncbi:PAS domain S-box protein [Desulfobacter postgatei]|uniref:hybrid sensor histidine kinase/response regulator n=1 Tax=Desulfobacter postgatei TaxID=2293 RepID=UPI00259BDFD3|nr:PAS domain S-box protein [uncultured Desulfobacter sp.]